ncbi:translesion DNA synthesis-associated protein ImuA [Plasticicumulans lactativorans]|uniref:translesion DNA synthesis-associated protein ImuA n=1 Tax=Plasticicumulans lactativorans TaxID=1133106 RepID=UPI001FB338F9|nr:translesion DNA synthesis-associated protein ImuA [Plasticicumulans lactativorans]
MWRAGTKAVPLRDAAAPSGRAALDAAIGGGWPLGTLIEVLLADPAIGELGLVAPALATLAAGERWIVLVDPPQPPYAPAWAAAGVALERLLWVRVGDAAAAWACEQAPRDSAAGTVLAWGDGFGMTQLRRLQLAAAHGGTLGWLFRAEAHAHAHAPSPAPLRLHCTVSAQGVCVAVLKRRGGPARAVVAVRCTAVRRRGGMERPASRGAPGSQGEWRQAI